MTRKDFEIIAVALKTALPVAQFASEQNDTKEMVLACHRDICGVLANALAQTNPRFDTARFLKACGVE